MTYIQNFSVQKLHNVFSYDLSLVDGKCDLSVLYGDNGSGKTTLMKLLYHILSSERRKGHVSAISKIPFYSARVTLSNGCVISVRRDGAQITGFPLRFKLEIPGRQTVNYHHVPESMKNIIFEEAFAREMHKATGPNVKSKAYRLSFPIAMKNFRDSALENSSESAYEDYYTALSEISVAIYFLGTDRRILSDFVDPVGLQRGREAEPAPEQQISALRAAYLKDALQRGGRYINRQIIKASNLGSKNMNDIYADIFLRVLKNGREIVKDNERYNARSMAAKLLLLKRRQRNFVKLGLTSDLNFDSFIEDLKKAKPADILLLEKIASPFVATLEARLDAMDPIRNSVEAFLGILNEFFKFKKILYTPANGFVILGPASEELGVEQLSSGEQQLLLIFCSVLASNESDAVFIIDEPEISLNIKWQREILESLQRIGRNSNKQLIISTHSIELLSQNFESVVPLEPVINNGPIRVENNE